MRVLLAIALSLLALRARGASLVLSGPASIHVGDEVSYELQISLSPGEHIYSAAAQLLVEDGRSLADFAPTFVDAVGQRGFFSAGYTVDVAYLSDYANYLADPLVMDGGPAQPFSCDPVTNTCDFLPDDYSAQDGPFLIVPFTLTARAPGVLRIVPAPLGLSFGNYTIADPPVQYGYRDADGNVVQVPLPPPDGGAYAQITIIPEPSRFALGGLALAIVAAARRLGARRSLASA